MTDHERIVALEGRATALEVEAEHLRFFVWTIAVLLIIHAVGKWIGWW